MASGLADAIKALVQDRGISEELVKQTIEDFLFAAYKRKFGTTENAVVKFTDDDTEVSIYARKNIVAEVLDPVFEILLKDALLENEESDIGDELLAAACLNDLLARAVISAAGTPCPDTSAISIPNLSPGSSNTS